MVALDEAIAKGIARVSLWSSRNAKAVVLFTLLLTVGLGYGITMITTNVDVADALPRGNPNTEAAYNLTENFRSTFTQQVTFQIHVDETGENWAAGNEVLRYRGDEVEAALDPVLSEILANAPFELQPDSLNITDQVYIYAMAEMIDFIQERTPFDRQVAISNIYALIFWTVNGGQGVATEEDFRLPDYTDPAEAQLYRVVDASVKAAVLDSVDALASPSWNHAAVLFMPANDNDDDVRDLGQSIIDARNEYIKAVDEGRTVFKIWGSGNPPDLTVDLPVANAHSSALVEEDFLKLMPIIGAFIIVCLFVAFRDARGIAISFMSLAIGVSWTYGLMGYMGIALNTLNLTIIPLIMGVGIDYAIHMINEFMEHKSHGMDNDQSFIEAGRRAGLAMFIATLTTSLGLVVMMFSPSLLMAQLGFLSAVAIVSIYLITISFIPAALTLMGGTKMGQSFTPSRAMPALARGVSVLRVPMLMLVIVATIVAGFGATLLSEEAFGDPGKNFPEDDEIRQQHERGLAYFYEVEDPTVKTNILTFEGPNIYTPENIQFMRYVEEELTLQPRVDSDTLRTLMFFVETWQTVKGGPECVVPVLLVPQAEGTPLEELITGYSGADGAPCADQLQFPDTEEALISEIDQMFESPMKELASLITNHPTLSTVAMTFAVDAGPYEEAEEAWFQIQDAIANAAARMPDGQQPEGVNVAMVGNTATNYLFVSEQLPWLNYLGYASSIILFLLVLLFTRSIKATFVATALATITTVWWLGLLPALGIGLAITLMLPLVFIFNIGTDYVVHLIWNIRAVGNVREVFATTGKAILFSAITTIGAFAVFAFIQNVAVSRTMVATTLAIVIIFVSTLSVIPIFYKVGKEGEPQPPNWKERRLLRKEAKRRALVEQSQREPIPVKPRPKRS